MPTAKRGPVLLTLVSILLIGAIGSLVLFGRYSRTRSPSVETDLSGAHEQAVDAVTGDDSDSSPATGSQSQQQTPCPLTGVTTRSANSRWARATITNWVTSSHAVAKAVISSTGPAYFDTPDGLPPLPVPATADEIEEEDYEYNESIFKIVVVDSTHYYSGTQATGYVLTQWGGEHPGCPGYEYIQEPAILTGGPTDAGMLFLREPPADLIADNPFWYQKLIEKQVELNAVPGNNYDVMIDQNWFLYDGADAVSGWGVSMPVTQLEAEVAALTGP